MLIAKKGADLATDDIWLNILTAYRKNSGEKYYNAFPVSIRSTVDGKEWTYAQHQLKPHGTNHKFATEYEVVADFTSKLWERTTIWDGGIFEHPKDIKDEAFLIRINDDDVDSEKDIERLRVTLKTEFQHYLNNINKLSPELRKRIIDASMPTSTPKTQ